ncbi:PIN domain-containing protein [Brevibacterium sp. UCMA 11754]|uniref:PIN domain-containing protein n=1 Tax=Brevibacterium sp. UCMA 11754 TaxID=2749198 RepID=UPI001F3B26D5|nr:PIN domain-containing protein [Brevibacterium sp. UCMA 11754]MCF2570752.1 hypothetical protein [Brevibacterium sp. UCMA 11754]
MTQRVFVDANVLFSKTQMDWLFLMRMANDGMFQLHTTEDVFAEVLANMRKGTPRAPGHITRRRLELMRGNIDEVMDSFPSDSLFSGIDENDYHVHAAALASKADHQKADCLLEEQAKRASTGSSTSPGRKHR